MADSPAGKAGPSAQGVDRSTPESGPFALHQDAFNNMSTPMEEDDLLGEDLVDYKASPEHTCMDINVITFSADLLLSATMNLSSLSLTLVLKKSPSLNQRNW
jgi:hypothetical protein